MRRMVRLLVASIAVTSGVSFAAFAAAPVTPSYQGVEKTIQAISKVLGRPGSHPAAQSGRVGRAFRCFAQRSSPIWHGVQR